MPNWNYNLITLTAKTDAAKKQIHKFIDNHITKRAEKPNWNGSMLEIDNRSIIPIPEGILKLDTMVSLIQNDDGTFYTNPNYSKEAEDAQRKQNKEDYGYEDWWEFCIGEWGSKWGFCHTVFYNEFGETVETFEELHETLDKTGRLEIKSECAWSTATGILKRICELYPDIEMRCEWGEEQVTEYYGVLTYDKENGGKQIPKEDIELDEAFDMLGRLGLVSVDFDDGYFINKEKGIIDYDERLNADNPEYIPEDKREGIVFGTHED